MIILERLLPDKGIFSIDGTEKEIQLSCLDNCREGDVLMESNGIYITDITATQKRYNYIKALQDSLWE